MKTHAAKNEAERHFPQTCRDRPSLPFLQPLEYTEHMNGKRKSTASKQRNRQKLNINIKNPHQEHKHRQDSYITKQKRAPRDS